MNPMAYDFTDPAVVRLVQNHQPVELSETMLPPLTPGDTIQPIVLVVVCALDHEAWPCTAALALRQWQAEQTTPESPTGGGGQLG